MTYSACADLRMFFSRRLTVDLATLKGVIAKPNVPLADLKSIGSLKKDLKYFAKTSYIMEGLRVLEESPLQEDIVRRSFLESPDSVRYAWHIHVLEDKKVLGIYGKYCHTRHAILDANGVELPTPLIVRYSAVHKEPITARAIFNMVYSNALMLADTIKFSLLGTKHIISRMMSFDFIKGKLRIVSLDLLNSFYLMGVSPVVGQCCCVRLGDLVFEARVCPMGFRRSCGAMSAICTSCILKTYVGDADLGVDPSELTRPDVPGFIPLRDGGGIFVIYDSVLIVAEESNAAVWHKRLERNFVQAGLALKYNTLYGLVGTSSYGGMRLRTDRSGLYWSVEINSIRTWHSVVNQELVPSPRTLFRTCGWLRFVAPILGWSECKLGRLTKAQSRLGQVMFWDEPCVDLASIATAICLVRSVKIITKTNERGVDEEQGEERHRRSHVMKRKRHAPFYFAVDATPERWAVYEILANGVPLLWRAEYFGGYFDAENTWIPELYGSTSTGPETWPIDEAESFAMMQGIKLGHSRGATLLVCANDNQGVGWNYTNGYSKNDVVDAHIVEAAYTDDQCTLIIADTPTKENYADVGTRLDEVYPTEGVGSLEYRQRATWARVQAAHECWRETGKQYLLRKGPPLQKDPNEDICKEPEVEATE